MNFDMNTVWTRALELLGSNLQLLLVIAAVFMLLPTVAIYLLIPDFQALMDPTADPEAMFEQMSGMLAPLIGFGVIVTLFQFAGYGAMIALVGDNRPTVGQALATGFKILPSLIVVLVAFAIAYILVALIITTPIALLAGAIGVPGLAVLAVLLVLIFIAWLMTRMSLTMPALVLGETLNPISAIGESVRLTGPKQWMILLSWVLLVVTFTIISLLVSGAFGVLVALLGTGMTGMLILGLANGAISMASGMIISVIAAAMYLQLAGPSNADIEDTFG